ncbi:MAG TPA: hypothetical protein VMM14_08650 [Acidimicrobiia bacterium]|nr:hypothetical protein [Acidimicrobiia bacterium]
METIVKSEDDGKTKTHVGITVAKGPGRFRLILTRPYHEAGQIVKIPRDQITSIATVEPCNLGDDPSRSD